MVGFVYAYIKILAIKTIGPMSPIPRPLRKNLRKKIYAVLTFVDVDHHDRL